jgi:hypothetical protein
VKPDAIARHVDQCRIDRCRHAIDKPLTEHPVRGGNAGKRSRQRTD